MRSPPFDCALLAADTIVAARRLLGATLVRAGSGGQVDRRGRIVEVEAYVGLADLASHAHRGMTRRNAVMFGQPGRAYVYLVYGMHHCLNVVTEPAGVPAALLVRAVEPLTGIDAMRRARVALEGHGEADRLSRAEERIGRVDASRLASGPGLVCAAFSIDRSDDGADLCAPDSALRLEAGPAVGALEVTTGPRIGVEYAPEPWLSMPWRFWIAGSPAVSHGARAARSRAEHAFARPGGDDARP
jgi:DNA-3-methyladenine glycosylase